jgi:phosphohistidine phosphatase
MSETPVEERTLYVVRHGEAFSGSPTLEDVHRPLTAKGQADARRLGPLLRGAPPFVLWCSPATRTRQTAAEIVAALGLGETPTVFERRIYEGSLEALLEVLAATPPEARAAALIGHNPGVTNLVRTLLPEGGTGLGPILPGTLVALRTRRAWDALDAASCTLARYDAPGG